MQTIEDKKNPSGSSENSLSQAWKRKGQSSSRDIAEFVEVGCTKGADSSSVRFTNIRRVAIRATEFI